MHIVESISLMITIDQRFKKNHNALDINHPSNFDILHGNTVDSNGKFSLQVVRNSDFFFQNHIICRAIIKP